MLVARLRAIRTHLHAAESAQPNDPHLQALHGEARRVLHWARRAGHLTDAEVAELDAPQGGGTPKTPPDGGDDD